MTTASPVPTSILSTFSAVVVDETAISLTLAAPATAVPALVKTLLPLVEAVEVRDDFDILKFDLFPIDARLGEPSYPAAFLRSAPLPAPERDAFVVQFAAPLHPEWVQELLDKGATLIDYIPENALVVLASNESLTAAASALPIQFVALHQPIHKMSRQLLADASDLVDIEIVILNVPEDVIPLSLVSSNAVAVLRAPDSTGDRAIYRVTVPSTLLTQLAMMPAVIAIDSYSPGRISGEREAHLVAGRDGDIERCLRPSRSYLSWLSAKGLKG